MNSHDPNTATKEVLSRIRWLTALFIVGLVLSGATAIPVESEVDLLARLLGISSIGVGQGSSTPTQWLLRVKDALHETNTRYPFIAYGADWLAFGHFMIALAFVGAWRDPMRNRWLFDFGLLACALVIPYSLVFGAIRGIPIWWRLIDCSFGVLGALPLWLCRSYVPQLEKAGGCVFPADR